MKKSLSLLISSVALCGAVFAASYPQYTPGYPVPPAQPVPVQQAPVQQVPVQQVPVQQVPAQPVPAGYYLAPQPQPVGGIYPDVYNYGGLASLDSSKKSYEGLAIGGDFSVMAKTFAKDCDFEFNYKNFGGGAFIEGTDASGAIYGVRVGYNTLEGNKILSTVAYGGGFMPISESLSSALGLRATVGVGAGFYNFEPNEDEEINVAADFEVVATLGIAAQLSKNFRVSVDFVYDYLSVRLNDMPNYGQIGARASLAITM